MLYAVGLNHKTAPLSLREQVAFCTDELASSLQELAAQPDIAEAAILSTCNRTEVYCITQNQHCPMRWLADNRKLALPNVMPHLYVYQEESALQHIASVASGLDSMVLGEPQILGQVKAAFAMACEVGSIGSELNALFQWVLSTSKRVRHETSIGCSPVSIASLAVNLAAHIFAELAASQVLLIGVGNTIELCANYLKRAQVGQFVVANRTLKSGWQLANQLGGRCISIGEVPDYLAQVDIVISATASPLPLVGKGMVERALKQRKHKPILLIDLAMPRDIEPEVGDCEDVFLYNIDDLQQIAEQGHEQRKQAAKQAFELIDSQATQFYEQQKLRASEPTIIRYREKMQRLADKEYQRALQALANGQEPAIVLKEMQYRMINKLIHHPTLQLRQAALEGNHTLLETVQHLFALEKT